MTKISLQTEISTIGNFPKNHQTKIAAIIKEGKAALDLANVRTLALSEQQKSAIVSWFKNGKRTAQKPLDYGKEYAFKSIAIRAGSDRHVIKLERFYLDALSNVGVENVPDFLSSQVEREWQETTGAKSITKMVKRAIVNQLTQQGKQL